MAENINSSAETVIIGGGAVGCAVAYKLASSGKKNILLLEKEATPASVTTAQAAGLVGQVRSSIDRTLLAMWSVKTFSELEANRETEPSWKQVGSLRVALTAERVQEFKRLKEVADVAGLEVDFLEPSVAKEKWPLMDFSKAKSILWCSSDGYLQPNDLTMAYVNLARKMGVRFETNTKVIGLNSKHGRISEVLTNQGSILTDTVINAAGAHAYHVAGMAGLDLPIIPVRHEFCITVPCDDMNPNLPVLRIPDLGIYIRAEVNSILIGGWESTALSLDPRQRSAQDPMPAIEEDWDVLAGFAKKMSSMLPCLKSLGIRHVFKGWPTFVPDGKFIIGESRNCPGFIMAGGCNAHGVSGSAGIGRHVVESMLDEDPSDYVKSLSPDRFLDQEWDWHGAQQQAKNVYQTYYSIAH